LVFLGVATSRFDWLITQKRKKEKTMEAPQNKWFYFEV
jgi:hypothetical protein